MKELKNIMLLSDMDGTLLGDDMRVSSKNKEAIDRFIEAGGTFGIATGRSQVNVKPFIEGVSINGPSILYNGAMLYDFHHENVVDVVTLEKAGLKDVMKWILHTYPEVMIFVYTKDESHLLSGKELADEDILKDHEPYVVSDLTRIEQEPWVKILLAGIGEDLEEIRRHLEEKDPEHLAGARKKVIRSKLHLRHLSEGIG